MRCWIATSTGLYLILFGDPNFSDPGEVYRQRLDQYLKRNYAGTSYINGSSPYMAARAGGLVRLDAMAPAAVDAGA